MTIYKLEKLYIASKYVAAYIIEEILNEQRKVANNSEKIK